PARFERGLSELRHRAFEPRRRPRLERGFDRSLAAEMNERLDALGRVADRGALLDGKPRLVQLRDLAQRSRDDHARRRAGGARLAELAFELAGAPGEGGIDQAVERRR